MTQESDEQPLSGIDEIARRAQHEKELQDEMLVRTEWGIWEERRFEVAKDLYSMALDVHIKLGGDPGVMSAIAVGVVNAADLLLKALGRPEDGGRG